MKKIKVDKEIDNKLFFKQIKRVMKYKNRSKIVSIIKMDDKFLNNKDSMKEAAKYFQNLFHEESKLIVPECLNQKDYSFNLETAISELSRNKTAGIDSLPAE